MRICIKHVFAGVAIARTASALCNYSVKTMESGGNHIFLESRTQTSRRSNPRILISTLQEWSPREK